jgi:lysophospholipase L1-like esterase
MIVKIWMGLLAMMVLPSLVRADASFKDFDRRAREGQAMSVVFFGGSLTWGANASDPQRTSYRALMGQYLQAKYPHTPFTFHDAAIGGTGSKLGLFRIDRDVLSRKPDLVFLDFTANDNLYGTDVNTLDAYETLLRELIGRGIPVEQAFFAFKFNFGAKWNPDGLHRVIDHRKLAAAYHTATGDVYPLIHDRLTTGKTTIDDVWPIDSAHPGDFGYSLFFEAMRDGFEQAIADGRVCTVPAKPLFADHYLKRQRIRLADGTLPEGWSPTHTYRTSLWFDGLSSRWMGTVAQCTSDAKSPPAPLRVSFVGTFVGLFGEGNGDGLSFKASVDGKPLLYHANAKTDPTDVWPWDTHKFGGGNLFMWRELSDTLSPGSHTLVIQPLQPAAGAPAGQLRIESVCAAGD